jgi:hypothetical protein
VSAIVHLLEYRIRPGHDAEVTSLLRRELLTGQGRQHFVATTWCDQAALARAVDAEGLPAYLAARTSLLSHLETSRYRFAASTGLGREGAKVLRLYRTTIAADAVESWERRAVETIGRLVATPGLLAAEAGVETAGEDVVLHDGDARITVLTAWANGTRCWPPRAVVSRERCWTPSSRTSNSRPAPTTSSSCTESRGRYSGRPAGSGARPVRPQRRARGLAERKGP